MDDELTDAQLLKIYKYSNTDVQEIQVGNKVFRLVKDEINIDLYLDPSRKRDGLVALIAIIGDRRRELWASEDANLTELIQNLKDAYGATSGEA